jgi:protease IV
MTKSQKFTISIIIALPIILGIIIAIINPPSGVSKFSSLMSKKIGLVEINDVIYSSEEYVSQLREFRENDGIAGVILRIDSPGGAVAPSQEIFKECMKYRISHKPLVVSMGNLAASGGYYVACPASKIFANPGSTTGSIGVIMNIPHYYKLLNKIGVDIQVLKSGELKDVGSSNREMTPREKIYLQHMLDDIHMQFIEDVSRARGINPDSLIPIADGRVFTGRQAIGVRLVDTLGSYEDALAYLKEHLGIPANDMSIEKKNKGNFFKKLLTEELFDRIPLLKKIASPAGSYFLFDFSTR